MKPWRDWKLEYSHVWSYAIDRLNAYYNGRFVTFGDLADATDAEILAVPLIGKTILAHFRQVVAEAREAGEDPEDIFNAWNEKFESRTVTH